MSAPDLVAPVLGFRAWRVRGDGALVPWSATDAGPWVPGPNEARCLWDPSGRRHLPPGRSCSCGIYALADLRDSRLLPRSQAVGAIAAWGEVEVHRTGFRAQYACVLALGVPSRCPAGHAAALEDAARRYRVPLVDFRDLTAVASAYAQPLAFDALSGVSASPSPPPRSPGPPLNRDGLRGIACEDHVWLRIEDGRLVAGITRALAHEVQIGSPVEVAGSARLAAGDRLARIGDGDAELRVAAPVGAWGIEANPAVQADPDLLRVDPEGAGWLLRFTPTAWAHEGGGLAWGRAADRVYAATLARGGDAFAGARARWLRAHAHVTSAADVLAELRAARERPRFADPDEVRARVVARLQRALARPEVGRRVARANVRVAWRLHAPEVDVVLDLRPPAPHARCGEPQPDDLTLHAAAETADDYFGGRLDLAAALRAGVVQASAPAGRVLAVESVIKSLHAAYRAAP